MSNNETATILAAMFTENTGRHMLDSGGAYGRNWERNQGRDVQSFLDEPEASFDVLGDSWYVSRSTFHFLNDRLTYNPKLQAEFDAVAEDNPDEGWMTVIDTFLSEQYPDANSLCVNTYNHENTLDQVIQYWQVSTSGDATSPDFVILQVHGGCDVRGGYTAPKLFDSCGEVGLLDDNSVHVGCEGVEPPQYETLPGFPDAEKVYHNWYSDDAGYNWYSDNTDNELTNETLNSDGQPACADCGARLHVDVY
jgi:hypothetical protein